MFKLIKGIDKHQLYLNAFNRVLEECDKQPKDLKPIFKKLITYGVRVVNTKRKPETLLIDEIEYDFKFANLVKICMAALTPKEFIQLFPITKEFNGHKWQTKDYFYTRDYIGTLERDKPIGEEEILNFLWEYTNRDITMFNVQFMCCLSDIRRIEGQPGLMEQWAEDNGVKTYKMYTDNKGKKCLLNKETGKIERVKRKVPKYIKAVK